VLSWALPFVLFGLGYLLWWVWFFWGALLLGLQLLRVAPVYDETPLDRGRKLAALATLAVFIVCFMPAPILNF
jgi:hypothetical protein